MLPGMVTTEQKIAAEVRMRKLLAEAGLPDPDQIEYGHSCIRLLWHDQKAAVVIDLEPSAKDEFDPADEEEAA
jgi:hypothetical protein